MRKKDGFMGGRSIVIPQMVVDIEAADPLASSLYVTDIGYYPHASGHFRERRTPITENVLIYCYDGEGWCRVGNCEYEVKANQFFILPAGKAHAYGSSERHPWTIYWVHFTGTHAHIYAEGAQQPQDVKPGIMSRISNRNNMFEEIFNTLYDGFSLESLRYVSSMLHYYLASMRYLASYRNAEHKPFETNVAPAVIHFMRENIEKRLSLSDIAAYTGFSPSYFSALFRKQTGYAPLNYFNRMKMEEACRMLLCTDMKINQICHKVGFDDCYYFSRLFTSIIKMSPKHYRFAHTAQNANGMEQD